LTGEDDGGNSEADKPPAFGVDTWADKGIRFGCGALLATLIVASVLVYAGAGFAFGAVVAWLTASVSCGVLAVLAGDRFVKKLLRIMEWL
jgi:hypothetical protein